MDDGLSLASDIDDDKLSIISETSVRIALDEGSNIWDNFIHQLQSEEAIVQDFS